MSVKKLPRENTFSVTHFTVNALLDIPGKYTKNEVYTIHIQKMDTRFAVFKAPRHWKEDAGYLVFKSKDNIWENFSLVEKNTTKVSVDGSPVY